MASKSHNSLPDLRSLIEQWHKERETARQNSDPLMDRIRVRRERIRKRIGVLDDSVDLIREDRDR